MRAGSFDFPPLDGKAIDERIDRLGGVLVGAGGQVSVSGGGQDRAVAEDLLYFEQVDARFDQMSGITMTLMPLAA